MQKFIIDLQILVLSKTVSINDLFTNIPSIECFPVAKNRLVKQFGKFDSVIGIFAPEANKVFIMLSYL